MQYFKDRVGCVHNIGIALLQIFIVHGMKDLSDLQGGVVNRKFRIQMLCQDQILYRFDKFGILKDHGVRLKNDRFTFAQMKAGFVIQLLQMNFSGTDGVFVAPEFGSRIAHCVFRHIIG